MGLENFENRSLPAENELPLDIKESRAHAQGGEATVFKALVNDGKKQERLIALKQVRKQEFASESEMKKSKEFYDFLKSYPEFGRFVPDTLYFKARETSRSVPQLYSIQRFIEGKSIDSMKDSELYKNPEVVRQLLDLSRASIDILQRTREEKKMKPDFGTAFSANMKAILLGNYSANPRYTTNILISDKPGEKGERVYFVDTGANVDERVSKTTEAARREVGGRLQELQLRRWAGKLQKILDAEAKIDKEHEWSSGHVAEL